MLKMVDPKLATQEFEKNSSVILKDLNKMVDEPNLFRIIGVQGIEIRHSNFLGYLMDPREKHGLNGEFLKLFLTSIFDSHKECNIDSSLFKYEQFTVSREYCFGDNGNKRQIDILLRGEYGNITGEEKNILICIENKITSHENNNQLEAYKTYLDESASFNGYIKFYFYLTPTNEKVSQDWITIGYDKVLAAAVDCYENFKFSDDHVKRYVEEYISVIRRNIMFNDEKFRDECLKIYRAHSEALDAIYSSLRNFLTPTINTVLDDAVDASRKGSKPVIYRLSGKNAEIRFSSEELDKIPGLALAAPNSGVENEWHTGHRIVYNIIVDSSSERGIFPYQVRFTAMFSKILDKSVGRKIFDYNTFDTAKKGKTVGKNSTIVLRKMDIDINDINVLTILKSETEKFIKYDIPRFEDELRTFLP